MPRLSPLATALALALVAPAASALTVQVGDMNAVDWRLVSLTDDGPAEVNMVTDTSLGNPGSHWVLSYATPRTTGTFTATNRLAALYTATAYDPAAQGALEKLSFSADIKGLSSAFTFDTLGAIRPALMQDGIVYTVVGTDFTTSKTLIGTYVTKTWDLNAVSVDWVTAVAGSTQHPDFTIAGAPIQVGFRYTMGTSCSGASGCNPGSAFLSIDNFAATLTPVPEPSAWLLLGAGLGCLALRRRA